MCAGIWNPSLTLPSYSSCLERQIATLIHAQEAAEKCNQVDVHVAFLNVMVLLSAHAAVSGTLFKKPCMVAYGKLVELHAMVHHPKPAGYSVWLAEVFLSEYDDPHAFVTSEVDEHKQWCNGMKPLLERYQANRFGNLCAKFPF